MGPRIKCPSADVWTRLVARQVKAERAEQLYQHLADCPTCRQRFEERAAATGWEDSGPDGDTMIDPGEGSNAGSTIRQLPFLGSRESTPPPLNVAQFCERLLTSGLFSSEQIEQWRAEFEDDGTPLAVDRFAEFLVERDALTGFQADVLKAGHARGLVLGNYVVLDRVGRGGMGTVYRARHRRLNRVVALKTLSSGRELGEHAVTRFQREVQAVAALKHPNIAEAFDSDEADGVHFLVMEYVDGPNLSTYIKQFGPVSIAAGVELMLQAARGLAYAHENGIVHRDVKPGNLLVNRKGVVKILDMGLARRIGDFDAATAEAEMTQSGRVMGTVDYMAPEQALDAKRADARADIYSLGCTLYYLLTGHPPAPAGTLASKLLWHQNHSSPLLHSPHGSVPDALVELFRAMLGKDPASRPASMTEVVQRLEACRESLGERSRELTGLGIALVGDGDASSASGLPDTGANSQRPAKDWDEAVGWRDPPVAETPHRDYSRVVAYVATALVALIGFGALIAYTLQSPAPTPPNERIQGPLAGERPPQNAGSPVGKADSPRHQFAAWVVKRGGVVDAITHDGSELKIATLTDIPREAFRLRRVDLNSTRLADAELARLPKLDPLDELNLSGNPISASGLAHLRGRNIHRIDLSRTAVGNDALAELGELEGLKEVNLQHTNITDSGLHALTKLTELERLHLSDTNVGDDSVEIFGRMPKLARLSLNGTRFTPRGIRELRMVRNDGLDIGWDGESIDRLVAGRLLRQGSKIAIQIEGESEILRDVRSRADLPIEPFQILEIDVSNIRMFDDEDLELLSGLTRLELLKLEGTSVTGRGLLLVADYPALQRLDLGAHPVSRDQLATLQQRMPNCEIESRPPPDATVARWAIEHNAKLTVEGPDGVQTRDVTNEEQLPRSEYQVVELGLDEAGPVTPEQVQLWGDLRSLQLVSFDASALPPEAIASLSRCRTVRELRVRRPTLTLEVMQALAKMESLETLYLIEAEPSEDAWQALGDFTRLRRLSLRGTPVHEPVLTRVARMPNLKWLSLAETPVTDQSLQTLAGMTHLEELLIVETGITDAGIEDLKAGLGEKRVLADALDPNRLAARWVLQSKGKVHVAAGPVPNLAALPRDDCRVVLVDLARLEQLDPDEIVRMLQPCRTLQELDLSFTKIGDKHLQVLAQLPDLKVLKLNETAVTDQGIRALLPLPRLESLELQGTLVKGHFLAEPEGLGELRHLDLSNTQLDAKIATRLVLADSLQRLELAGNLAVDDGLASRLAHLGNLEQLGLRGTGLTDKGMQFIGKLQKLRELDLDGTRVSDAGVSELRSAPQLRNLSLYQTNVGDSTVDTLAQLKQLEWVNLTSTNVTDSGAQRLRETLPNCEVVKPPSAETDTVGP